MIIRINNEKKATHILHLLKELPYVEVKKIPKKLADGKKKVASKPEDLKKFFGIWADEKITLRDVRKKAWKR